MGILTSLAPRANTPGPANDFWYLPTPGQTSVSGVRVSADAALSVSTVFACVRVLSDSVAMLPLAIKERIERADGKVIRQDARNHPLWDVLHDQPNQWQTSYEYESMKMGHLLLRGNFYALIVPGNSSGVFRAVDQLIPLHPDQMKVEQLDDFRLRYRYRWEGTREEVYSQNEIHHLRGYSDDGIVGKSVLSMARDNIGYAVAAEQYAARFYSQNMRPSGVFKTASRLSPESALRLKEDLKGALSGLGNAHRVPVLEDGLEWQSIGMTHEDSQFLETQSFNVEQVARWFGVPLFLIQHTERSTSWGTGIEQMMLGYVTVSLMPWLVRSEKAITRDLIIRPRRFFPKYNVDMLLRGDIKTRNEAHRIAIMTGWKTRNEVRELEDDNPIEGLDDPLVPLNMTTIDSRGNIRQPEQESGGAPDLPPIDDRARMLAGELVGRAVRREMKELGKIDRRHYEDEESREEARIAFYEGHAEFLQDSLKLSSTVAEEYCVSQKINENADESEKIRDLMFFALGVEND